MIVPINIKIAQIIAKKVTPTANPVRAEDRVPSKNGISIDSAASIAVGLSVALSFTSQPSVSSSPKIFEICKIETCPAVTKTSPSIVFELIKIAPPNARMSPLTSPFRIKVPQAKSMSPSTFPLISTAAPAKITLSKTLPLITSSPPPKTTSLFMLFSITSFSPVI